MKEFIDKLIGRLEEEIKETWCLARGGNMVSSIKNRVYCDMKSIVKELAEEYNNGWIPCSERLPEAGKRYLVSAIWKDEDFEKHSVYDAVYGTDGIWHTYEYKPIMYEVIAWMPLPEPYQQTNERSE